MIRPAVLVIALLGMLGLPATGGGQTTPPAEPQSTPTFSSTEQVAQFQKAREDFAAGRYAEAFAALKPLHEAQRDDVDLLRFTAEAALDSGNTDYPLAELKPVTDGRPGSWQELLLLARVYAERHDDAARDAALATLVQLHDSGRHPKLNAVQVFLVERVPTAKGRLDLYYSLEPWSRYKIYEMARVFDENGRQVERITLESNDTDQPLWAQQHPQLAAQGMRMFSMDAYGEPQAGPNGTHTFTHATLGFYDGRPTYKTVRDRMLQAAAGASSPLLSSTTTGKPQ